MKRIVFFLMVALMTTTAFAKESVPNYDWKENRHSLSITAGAPSGYFLMREVMGALVLLPVADHAKNSKYFGAYSFQYHYQCLWWLKAGFKATWEGDSHEMYKEKEQTTYTGKSFGHTMAITPSVQFTYFNRKHVQLYSGIDLGLSVMLRDRRYAEGVTDSDGNQKKNELNAIFLPAINITPIAVIAGGEHVYFLAETNIGSDAFIKGGIGFRF